MTAEQQNMIHLYDMRNQAALKRNRQDESALNMAIKYLEVELHIDQPEKESDFYEAELPGLIDHEFLLRHGMETFWDCPHCPKQDDCFMVNKYQRIPRSHSRGGLGLCPNLKQVKKG